MTSETPQTPPSTGPTTPTPKPAKRRLTARHRARLILDRLGLRHFHRVVAMILATATLAIAIVTYLEVEAHSKAETAGADSQLRQIEASTKQINGKAQVRYDWTSAYRTWVELDLQAESADVAGDTVSRDRFLVQRNQLQAESKLLTPEYFANVSPEPGASGDPDVSRYEDDLYYHDYQILNEQADGLNEIKEFWHRKQSGFLTSLAFLSSALFISGLALTTPRPLARVLLGVGVVMIVGATGFSTAARLGSTPQLHNDAIQHYADGKSLAYRAGDDDGYNQAIEAYTKALESDEEYVNARVARADANVSAGIALLGTQQRDAEAHFHAAIADFEEARDAGHDDANFLWNIGWVYYLIGDYDHAIAIDLEAVHKEPDLFTVRHNLGLAYLVRGKDGDMERALDAFKESRSGAIESLTAAGGEAPSSTWSGLEDMASDFDHLSLRLEGRTYSWIQAPAVEAVKNATQVKVETEKQRDELESLIARFEAGDYSGIVPAAKARAANITVSGYYYDKTSETTQTNTTRFDRPTSEVTITADYDGMDGVTNLTWRIFRNGSQDRLQATSQAWKQGTKGSATTYIGYSYTSLWHYKAGYYVVELYADNALVGRTAFTIGDP